MSETQDHVRRLLSMLANLLESCLQRWWYLLKSPYGYVVGHYINMYDHVVIAALLYTTVLVSFPRILFPETMKLWIRGFFHAWKKKLCRTCHQVLGSMVECEHASYCGLIANEHAVKRIRIFPVGEIHVWTAASLAAQQKLQVELGRPSKFLGSPLRGVDMD